MPSMTGPSHTVCDNTRGHNFSGLTLIYCREPGIPAGAFVTLSCEKSTSMHPELLPHSRCLPSLTGNRNSIKWRVRIVGEQLAPDSESYEGSPRRQRERRTRRQGQRSGAGSTNPGCWKTRRHPLPPRSRRMSREWERRSTPQCCRWEPCFR